MGTLSSTVQAPTCRPGHLEQRIVRVPELHIWSTRTAGCIIETRSTQPNGFRSRAELQANGAFLRVEPVPIASDAFALPLLAAHMQQLAVSPPNWAGHYLAIEVLHTLRDNNELRYWGWTYRILRHGIPLTCAGDADGEPLVLDRHGWLVWPRFRRDFGNAVTILDHITIEMRA